MANFVEKYAYYTQSIFRMLSGFKNWQFVVKEFLNVASEAPKNVDLKYLEVRFRVRGKMDIWSVKEAFLDRFYEKYGFPLENGWNVIDIGAGIGEFTVLAAKGFPESRVFAFEPFRESFDYLQENIRLNKLDQVMAFSEAISSKTGNIVLDLSSGEPLQFQTKSLDGSSASKTNTVVQSRSLEDVFKELKLEQCDLIKIDCEGAEYDILFTTPSDILKSIKRVVMEYHNGVTQYNHQDMVKFLEGLGFIVRTCPNQVHAHIGYLWAWRAESH